MDEGEEPLACCLREIEEETGITELPHPTECNQIGYGNYFMFFLTRKIELQPRDKKEIMNARWVTLEEMSTLELNADVSMWYNAVTTAVTTELTNACEG
jgi:8-oxo-dGTP pyrophosphatase MutT (NUDIX family)